MRDPHTGGGELAESNTARQARQGPGGAHARLRRRNCCARAVGGCMRLKGRTALVTGGSRGIGRAIALALGEEGADVAINYVSSEKAARDAAEAITKMGRRAMIAQ